MAARKVTLYLQESLLADVDEMAAELGTTRSGFIANVINITRGVRSNAAIKRRIEAFYADPKNVAEDKKTARLLAANRSKEGPRGDGTRRRARRPRDAGRGRCVRLD
jgi:hypothetical protein